MKIAITKNVNKQDEILRQMNFSEKEISFIKDYVKNGGSIKELSSFADVIGGTLTGALTGALTAGMASAKEDRKKAIKKGLLAGAVGGLTGAYSADFAPIPSLAQGLVGVNIPAAVGGGLAGYLAALHEDGI
jgi:hypothetical protein